MNALGRGLVWLAIAGQIGLAITDADARPGGPSGASGAGSAATASASRASASASASRARANGGH